MNFDLPQQAKPWENKKSTVFKEWMAKQIKLDPKDWNQDFNAYVKQKEKESEEKTVYKKPTAEEGAEKTFTRYLDGLDITQPELQGKRILDIGCDSGDFIISCLKKGITQEAYGTDRELKNRAQNAEYRNNFFSKDFTDRTPVKDLDFVFSVGAISLYLDEENEVHAEEAIKEALRSIKKSGEVRIWPVKKALRGKDLDGVKEEEMVLARIMEKLEERLDIEWELKPTDVHVSGKDKDVLAQQVLVIRYKNPDYPEQ